MRRRHMAATEGGALCLQKAGHQPLEFADDWRRVTCQQCHVRRFLRSKKAYDKRKARELARASRPVPLLEEQMPAPDDKPIEAIETQSYSKDPHIALLHQRLADLRGDAAMVVGVPQQAIDDAVEATKEFMGQIAHTGDDRSRDELAKDVLREELETRGLVAAIEARKAEIHKPCDDCPDSTPGPGAYTPPTLEQLQGRLDGLTALLESQQDRLERIHGELLQQRTAQTALLNTMLKLGQDAVTWRKMLDGRLTVFANLQSRILQAFPQRLVGTVETFFGRRFVELAPRSIAADQERES